MNRTLCRLPVVVALVIFLVLPAMPASAAPRGIGGRRIVSSVVVVPRFSGPFFWGPAWGFGLGWGFYGPPYYPPPYMRMIPGDAASVELHVHPRKALVRVDGYEAGQARDFNSHYDPLWVKPGKHSLELSAPGYMTLRVPIRLSPGAYLRLRYALEEGAGVDPRSTKP